MTIYNWLIVACWAVFLVYWIISAFSAKGNSRSVGVRGFWFRLALAILATIVLRVPLARIFGEIIPAGTISPVLGIIAVVITAAGIGFAVWARAYLGRNWGMPMTVKENPELVMTGPYAFVRHPIYTGVIVAMFGSVLLSGLSWFMVWVAVSVYFIYSAYAEEKVMAKEFPETYPGYKSRTSMIIPFVF